MKMINKSILALGVVALAAGSSFAGGLGVNIDGTGYTRSGGIIAIDTSKVSTSGYVDSVVSASVSGQADFAQYRVKVGGQDYWYTILDTGDVTSGTSDERVRQEVFVRANNAGKAGAFFEQQMTSKDTGMSAACAFETTTTNNKNCLDIKMNFQGLNSADNNAERNFTIDMVLAEKGSTGTKRDYQQEFHFGQIQQGLNADTKLNMDCHFTTGSNCNTTTGITELTRTGKNLESTAAQTTGKTLVNVWFRDSIRVSSNEADNLKYEFETVNLNRPEDGSGTDDYRYQLF